MAPIVNSVALHNGLYGSILGDLAALPQRNIHPFMACGAVSAIALSRENRRLNL